MKHIRLPAVLLLTILLAVPLFLVNTTAIEPVHNASNEYKVSKYYAYLKSLNLTGDQRTDVVLVALTQLGYHEGNSDADMGGENMSGRKNFVEYNRLFGKVDNLEGNGVSYGYEWCAAFATWCVRQAGVPQSTVKTEISCIRLVDWFRANSTYNTRQSGYVPRSGDLIFFKDSDASVTATHVAIVRYVSGSTVYTIEGNTSDAAVALRQYSLGDTYIVGYGIPAYSSKPSSAIDFSMENGYPTGTYMINTASLNLRTGPSIDYPVSGSLSKGEKVTVIATDKSWGKIIHNGTERWISLGFALYLPQSRYAVIYNLNGGSGIVPAQPKADGVATTLSTLTPTRNGYSFAGWATSPEAKTAEYSPGSSFILNADTTLYAVWSGGNINIKFYNGDTLLLSADYPDGGEAIQPPAPTKPPDHIYKYTFAGWDTNNDGRLDIRAGEKVVASEGLVCRALFDQSYIEYKVKFLERDGISVIDEKTYHYGDTVAIPTPTNYREGPVAYTFTGWNTPIEATVSADASYFALYSESVAMYSVSFIGGNGNLMESGEYEYGRMVSIPAAVPQKDADATYTYSFREWDTAPGSVIADTVYRALFNFTYIDYKITFIDGDGNTVQETTAHYGDVAQDPGIIPSKSPDKMYKYEFSGWDTEFAPVSGDTEYKAVFNPVKRVYAVTFYNEDGSVYKIVNSFYGDMITPPEAPQKISSSGKYTFTGWSPALTPVSGNMNFTAVYSFSAADTADDELPSPGGKLTAGTIVSLAAVIIAAGGFIAYILIRSRRGGNPEV